MTKRRYPKSVAKHIRIEKGRIRKRVADPAEREREIRVLYDRFLVMKRDRVTSDS